jgi:fused signal recognition particle receptor
LFKFLKEKIKDAVKSFSSNADVEEVEEEIIQEQVDSIASQEKKEQEEQAQQKQQEQKQQQAKEEAKQQATQAQEKKEQEAKLKEKQQEEAKQQAKQAQEQQQKQEAKIAQQNVEEEKRRQEQEKQKQQETVALKESLDTTSQPLEHATDTAQESTPDSFSETTADADVATVDEYEQLEKKKGFFGRLFKKSEEPKEKIKTEPKEELLDEPKEESKDELKEEAKEEVKEIKEELASDVSTLAPNLESDKQLASSELAQEDDGLVQEAKQSDTKDTLQSKQRVTEQKKDAARADLFSAVATDATKQKKGFFSKIKERLVKFQLTEEKFEELFWEFELAMLENNVAVEVIEKIKQDMRKQLTTEQTTRRSIEDVIMHALQQSLSEILDVPTFDLIQKIKTKKPFVICIVGVNGSGKTTTLAKLIALLQQQQLSMVVAAADTFRAAAIQQLEEHTTKLGVKLIKHDYHADPAAVAFDAVQHARAKQLDVVLIDTAGRLQSNSNLMDELRKVVRVNKPDMNLFIGESITGNDCVEQAVAFHEAVGIDGIILSKADIDEKGGAAISVSHVTGKPILYLGTGQSYGDLVPFDKEKILAQLGF